VASGSKSVSNLRHGSEGSFRHTVISSESVSSRAVSLASARCKLPFYERGRKLSVLYKRMRLPNGYVTQSSYSRAGIMATFYDLCDSAKESELFRLRGFARSTRMREALADE
jgi:hypothetical protein